MTRIKVILAVAVLLVAMLVASAAPAMAHDNFFRNNDGRCFCDNSNGFFFNDGFRTNDFFPFFGFRNDFENCLFLPAVTIC